MVGPAFDILRIIARLGLARWWFIVGVCFYHCLILVGCLVCHELVHWWIWVGSLIGSVVDNCWLCVSQLLQHWWVIVGSWLDRLCILVGY